MKGRQPAALMAKPCRTYPEGGWWWRACQTQGWNYDDKPQRLRVLSEAVRRTLRSATELNATSDIDAVKRHLGTLADSVRSAREVVAEEAGQNPGEARRTMNHIRSLLAELEELVPDPGAYVRTLLSGIRRGQRTEIGGVEDLSNAPRMQCNSCQPGGHGRGRGCPGLNRAHVSELEQFRRTLNARIHNADGLANHPQLRAPEEQGEYEPQPEPEGVPF